MLFKLILFASFLSPLLLLHAFLPAMMHLWRILLHSCRRSASKHCTGQRMYRIRRLASGWGESGGSRHPLAKPAWIKSAVLQLAHNLPQAGCRTIANSFNLAHLSSKLTVSKTWVSNLLRARSAALALARRKSRHTRRSVGSAEPIQRVWGVDLTGLPLKFGETVDAWGIIDHGSRTVLQLEPLARFNSLILLGKLLVAFGGYGIPKAIRSDNASIFKTALMRTALKLLGVHQQFTALHSPWQNGRVERLWRTLKETLGTKPIRFRQGLRMIQEQMRFASFEAMQSVLCEFRDFYNHSRPNQALHGKTPAMVWNGQIQKRHEKREEQERDEKRRSARAPPRKHPADSLG